MLTKCISKHEMLVKCTANCVSSNPQPGDAQMRKLVSKVTKLVRKLELELELELECKWAGAL